MLSSQVHRNSGQRVCHTPVHVLSFVSSVWGGKNDSVERKKNDLFPGQWIAAEFPTCQAGFRLHLSDAQGLF